jgi:hypothetical protein
LREKLRKDRPSNSSKKNINKLCLEGLRGRVAGCAQGDEFCGRAPHHPVEFNRKGRTVEFLQGDFVRIRGLLDRVELQEGYSVSVEKVRSSGGQERRSGSRGAWFYSWIGISGVREVRLQLFEAEVAI